HTLVLRGSPAPPVTAAIEARVAVQESRGPKARGAVRPVTVVPGAVKLTPRGQGAQAKPPRPVPPGQARRASQQEPAKIPRGEEQKSDEKENSGKDKKDVRGNLHGGPGRH